jgi:hypothetical protein
MANSLLHKHNKKAPMTKGAFLKTYNETIASW